MLRESRAPKGASEALRTLDAHSNTVGTSLFFFDYGDDFGEKSRSTIYLDIYRNNSDFIKSLFSLYWDWRCGLFFLLFL